VGKVAKSSKVAKMPKAGKAPTMNKTSKSDGVARVSSHTSLQLASNLTRMWCSFFLTHFSYVFDLHRMQKAGTKKASTKKKGASPPKQVRAGKPAGKADKVTAKKHAAVSVKAKPTMKSAKKAAKSLKAGGFSKKTIPMKPVQVKKQGNLVNMTVAACGVAFFTFVKSSNKLMMAYMAAFFDAIQNNTALQAELKSMGLFEIRVDSTSNDTKKFTVGNNEIPELQLGCIVGRDATPKALQSQWNKVVAIADKHTSTVGTKNKYATRTHLGENLTPRSGPVPLDVLFPDEDTVNVMQVAYPDNDLEDIAGDPEILSQYYTNPKHGRNVVKSHIAGIPLVYHDEEEEDSEEEDSDDEESTDGEEEDVDDDEDEEEEEDEDDEEDDNGVDEEESEDSEEEDDMEVNSEDDGDGSVEDGNNGDSGASANPLIAAVVY